MPVLLKLRELTGTALETNIPNLHGDIVSGVANYNGMVKNIGIGQSAAKFVRNNKKVHRLTMSPNVKMIMDDKLTRVRDKKINSF